MSEYDIRYSLLVVIEIREALEAEKEVLEGAAKALVAL